MAILAVVCGSSQTTRTIMEGAFKDNEGYESKELGFYILQIGSHQFNAFVEDPKCQLISTTGFVDDRKVDDLAALAAKHLSAANKPE